jgi:hypothetical protein
MGKLLGCGPSVLHPHNELIGSERAEEIGNVSFRSRQSRYQVLTRQVFGVHKRSGSTHDGQVLGNGPRISCGDF